MIKLYVAFKTYNISLPITDKGIKLILENIGIGKKIFS